MAYLDFDGLTHYDGLIKAEINGKIDIGGRAGKIPFGHVDSTSTNTVFTATVDGLTELTDGTCVMLKNGVVTSASGWTLNVNGLGAKPVYSNMHASTRETTLFNVNYTMLFVYDSTRVEGGCWINYRGYFSDANSVGYQLRTNSSTLPAAAKFYRYRILFTSADGTHWVPANTSSSTNGTAKRDVNQTPIDPFAPIVYYSPTTAIEAEALVTASVIWQQYGFNFGYSFNRTGASLTLTYPAPVYLKCAPQSDGSAIIDATTPYVQDLPTTNDGKIYIYLGIAYSATNIELRVEHPVYWHDGTGIRLWTGAEPPTYTLPAATTSTLGGVKVDGTTITANDGIISAVGGGGGGGSYDYRIDVTIDDDTVTADYNGSTLTEIATAIVSDPATNVLAIVSNANTTTDIPVKASVLNAAYDVSWGDMASSVTLLSFKYDSGDDRLFARRTQLAGYGNSTQEYRIS